MKATMVFLFILIVQSVFFSEWLCSEEAVQPLLPEMWEGMTVAAIRFNGNSRTADHVVRRELTVAEGKPLTRVDLEETIIRLKNLQVFSKVEPSFSAGESPDDVILQFTVQEKWTTIPIFK